MRVGSISIPLTVNSMQVSFTILIHKCFQSETKVLMSYLECSFHSKLVFAVCMNELSSSPNRLLNHCISCFSDFWDTSLSKIPTNSMSDRMLTLVSSCDCARFIHFVSKAGTFWKGNAKLWRRVAQWLSRKARNYPKNTLSDWKKNSYSFAGSPFLLQTHNLKALYCSDT